MLETTNTQFIPPLPDSIILNEGGSNQIPFEQGKTYRIRMISFAAFAATMINFKSHAMKVIMQDGSYVQETTAEQLRISPGQRYDVLLTPNLNDTGNYPFLAALDINADYTTPSASPQPISWDYNITGYLVSDSSQDLTSVDVVSAWTPSKEISFANPDSVGPWGPVDQTIQLDFNFCLNNYSIPQACFNGQPYVEQVVPTLYSAATTGQDNTNPVVYGGVNPFIVEQGQTVDLVVNNLDTAIHPFHLHGHKFQVLALPDSGAGQWPGTTAAPDYPSTRDVVTIQGSSYAVLRFQADNPGVWLFHCHIEWHVEMGLTATIIEGPEQLRGLTFPQDQLDACALQNIPTSGNAAGNTVNYTDTSGMRFVNPVTYTG